MAKTDPTTLWFTLEDDHTARWLEVGRPPCAGDLGTLAAHCAAAGHAVWLLDARSVSCHEVALPPASARLQAKALPFALEDQVLGNVEALAVASVSLGGDRHGAAVTDREALAQAHARLVAAGVVPTAIVPEALCLPWREGEWSLLLDARRGWLRCGRALGFGFEAADWRAFVTQAAALVPPPARLRVFGPGLPENVGIALEICLETGPTDLLGCLGAELQAGARNQPVRRGRGSAGAMDPSGRPLPDFAPQLGRPAAADGQAFPGGRWRWAAGLLLAGLACHGAFLGWHAATLEGEVAAVQAANEALLQARFPEISRVVDVRAQATQALAARTASGAGSDRFLTQVAAVGAILASPGGEARVAALDFERDALEVRVEVSDMAAVDRLQRALQEHAVAASTLSVEKAENGVRLALRLGSAP